MGTADREVRVPKPRPDSGPMRFALGLTGLVAATAMVTAVVRPPHPAADAVVATAPSAEPTAAPLQIRHVTQYVQLKRGETAPPGATVVTKPDPSPRVEVVTVPAPPARRIVVVTRQSGAK